jgi:hypothetical protein
MKTMLLSIALISFIVWVFIVTLKSLGIDVVGGIKTIIDHIRGDDSNKTV